MASSSNVSLPTPPVFGGNEYDFWSAKMKTFLRAYDLWESVEKGYTPPENPDNLSIAQMKTAKVESTLNFKALSFLYLAVAESIFPRIVTSSTTKEAWDTLQEEFQGTERVRVIRLLNLRRDYENLKMKGSETVKDYISKLLEVVNQMRIYGEKLTDQKLVEKVLISLPDKYDSKVSAIEESKDLTKLTLNELLGSLHIHELRICKKEEVSAGSAFQVKHKNKQTSFKESKKNSGEKYN
ncbi:DUF4219 domain-containing protein/UBN2 domain-containing protein [Cephalotus follicularis]|uniref:DUF4219 domain-containing protein/UBN2 domain-containing protein n=1 Tax=Cephalotus follicularis TaxID=3775 RepID=A0A1Q3CV90_CEPFO|nr:DUF4219 domain-containing protein/UBN2 domain-containing protein [Cephalotus follicularis]